MFSIGFYISKLFVDKENMIINIIFLALVVLYALFLIVMYKSENKQVKKIGKKIFKFIKLTLKAVALSITLYNLYIAATNVDAISIIILTLSIILWVIQLLLEIISLVLESKIRLITNAFKLDVKPIVDIHNFFTKKENDWNIDYSKLDKDKSILDDNIKAKKTKKNK